MTIQMALPGKKRFPLRERGRVRLVTSVALLLAKLKPHKIRKILEYVSQAATPVESLTAERIYSAVVTVSPKCAGWKGCLPRSISIALLCRLRGQWPTWCAGVRSTPPFAAHAWVESDGQLIGEPGNPSDYRALMRVEVGH